MAEEIVLHSALKYKPDEAKDIYVKLYLEGSSGDILIDKDISNSSTLAEESTSISTASVTTLTEAIERLVDSINRRAYTNLFQNSATLIEDDPTLKPGQIAFESDTGKFKVGNGTTKYNQLPYFFNPS